MLNLMCTNSNVGVLSFCRCAPIFPDMSREIKLQTKKKAQINFPIEILN